MASPPSAGLSLYIGGQGVGNTSPVSSADWSGMLASNFAGNTSPRVGVATGLGTGSGPGSAGALDGLAQSLSGLNMGGGISPSPGGDHSPTSLSSEHNAVFFNSTGANLAGLTPGAAVAAAFSSGGHTNSSANSGSGVQTLYGSNDPAQAMLAVRLQQAQQAAAASSNALLQAQQNSILGGLQGLANSARTSAEMNAVYGAAPQQLSSSLYIKNLPPDADKLFLYERFSPYGAILSVKILFDPQTGQCRGVGFVNYSEHASAVRAIQALHGTKLGDKLLHVSLQTPRIRAT